MTTIDTRDRAKTRRTFIRDRAVTRKLGVLRELRNAPSPYTDAAPVRVHLERLHAMGLPDQAIARAAGVSAPTVTNARRGRYSRCLRPVAQSLLAVSHVPHPAQRFVLTVGARRRLRALGALGWSQTTLAAELGVTREALQSQTASTLMTYGNWLAIHDLYERLSLTLGPSDLTRSRARTAGWPPPLAWDDDAIDDPSAGPALAPERARHRAAEVDLMAVDRSLSGDRTVVLNTREKREVATAALDRGWSVSMLAARTGWSLDGAEKAMLRTAARRATARPAAVAS